METLPNNGWMQRSTSSCQKHLVSLMCPDPHHVYDAAGSTSDGVLEAVEASQPHRCNTIMLTSLQVGQICSPLDRLKQMQNSDQTIRLDRLPLKHAMMCYNLVSGSDTTLSPPRSPTHVSTIPYLIGWHCGEKAFLATLSEAMPAMPEAMPMNQHNMVKVDHNCNYTDTICRKSAEGRK